MTDRRDDGFSVAPQRLGGPGGGRGRRRGRALAARLGVSAAVLGIAILGPRLSSRPNLDLSYFATPTPRHSAEPTVEAPIETGPSFLPGSSPLPFFGRPGGAAIDGRIGLGADGFEVLDL